MCGIVGVIGKLPSKSTLVAARDRLRHRGPDDQGIYYSSAEQAAFGHRRLAIIDLSTAGRQPFFSNDERYVLVFNGEIYNYLEIKAELKDFYQFQTKTDTEVLLAAYLKWGKNCFAKFNGMFAFAIWDRREQKLFCGRDRLGIKPFFYAVHNDTFYFASEIKALFSLGMKARLNEMIIYDYLYYGLYDHTDETFFKDIRQLPAGHYLLWQKGKFQICEYWDLAKTQDRSSALSDQEVIETFKNLIADSLRLRFRSDVPVGIYLSSGFDSNVLFYYARELMRREINIFTSCSPLPEYDECSLIEQYLDYPQKRQWYRSFLDLREGLSSAQQMNLIQDQPFGGFPTIAFGELNRVAQEQGTTVLLHGQGLDELFAGYKYYQQEYQQDEGRKINQTISLNYSQDTTLLVDHTILAPLFVAKFKGRKPVFPAPFSSHLLNAQYRDIAYTKIPRTLRFNDHISMAYGRELRLPYLDYRFVEFCFWLPPRFKLNSQEQKVLLRKIFKDTLPQEILKRPKKTFGASQIELFRRYYQKEILSLLHSTSFLSRPYWDHRHLKQKIKAFFEGVGENSFFLWQCINLELWLRAYIDV